MKRFIITNLLAAMVLPMLACAGAGPRTITCSASTTPRSSANAFRKSATTTGKPTSASRLTTGTGSMPTR